MTFVPQPEHDEGGQKKIVTTEPTASELLNEILKQVKIMNMHLAIITDNDIKKTEV